MTFRRCEPAVLGHRLIRAFLLESQGVAGATALGVQAGDVAGIFNIGVPPAFRGQGHGRAATATVLSDAYASGAQTAVLTPSRRGWGLYRRMGFAQIDAWAAFEPVT